MIKHGEFPPIFWEISQNQGNIPKSRTIRALVTSHGGEISVTEANPKIAEFVINHEIWEHWCQKFQKNLFAMNFWNYFFWYCFDFELEVGISNVLLDIFMRLLL